MNSPRLVFMLVIIIFTGSAVLATDYYVSVKGDDSSSGLSPKTPWKTINKVNTEFYRMKPGDRILFKRGERFYGALKISRSGTSGSPIIISAFENGPSPVISGFIEISGWKIEGNGIYSKAFKSESNPKVVLLNGINTPLGRWPNSGWMTIDSHTGLRSLTDDVLGSEPNWKGAEVVVRSRTWVIDRRKIADHAGNTLTYASLSYEPVNGNGYFIQDHINTLDQQGEWYYNESTFFMYFGSGSDPENNIVKISNIDYLTSIVNCNHISIENLCFEGANIHCFNLKNADFISIKNCETKFNGENGINAVNGCDYLTIRNNSVSQSNNIGIFIETSSTHCNILNNKVEYSGSLPGMGQSGDDSYSAIYCQGHYSLISHNSITNTGYIGIRWGGQSSEVSFNFINYTCLCKDDGGGIYSYEDENTDKTIKYNIVLNGKARPEGWHYYETVRAHGIYVDGADNINISNNTVAFNDGSGIYINVARNITAEYNTCFSNTFGIYITSNIGDTYARNLNIQHNIFFASGKNQVCFFYATKESSGEVPLFGISDNNYFASNADSKKNIIVWINAWGWAPGDKTFYELEQWQSKFGKDLNSKKIPDSITDIKDFWIKSNLSVPKVVIKDDESSFFANPNNPRFEYNPTDENRLVFLDEEFVDIKGTKYLHGLTLLPHTSIILIPIK